MGELIKCGIASILAIGTAVLFYLKSLNLAPAAYQLPRILIMVLALLAVGMFLEAWIKYRQTRKGQGQEEENERINHWRPTVFTAMIFLYILAIEPLGYFITTPLFISGALLYLRAARLRSIVIITVGFTLFVYLLFVKFLYLPIPMGLFS